jgi:hypothetical protein
MVHSLQASGMCLQPSASVCASEKSNPSCGGYYGGAWPSGGVDMRRLLLVILLGLVVGACAPQELDVSPSATLEERRMGFDALC